MSESDKIMANRIRFLRKKAGLTQEELGNLIGVQKSAIRKYEKGEVENIKRANIKKLAEFFNVSPAYLMGFADIPKEPKTKKHTIPVLGRVVAGIPLEAVEEIIDYEEISEAMASQGDFFALQVKGDSMEPRIRDGDVVIVRKQEDVDNGDIAIMLVNGDEATIKKVQKFEGGINLIPSNSTYPVLTYTTKDVLELPVRCLGKVIELRAKF